MNTTENNKKIAEFMGIDSLNLGDRVSILNEPNLIYHRKTTYETDGLCKWCGNDFTHGHSKKCYVLDESKLLYNSSWDWLMEVVEKILNISLELDEMERYYNITDAIPQIEDTYNEVIAFIDWYNENGAKEN